MDLNFTSCDDWIYHCFSEVEFQNHRRDRWVVSSFNLLFYLRWTSELDLNSSVFKNVVERGRKKNFWEIFLYGDFTMIFKSKVVVNKYSWCCFFIVSFFSIIKRNRFVLHILSKTNKVKPVRVNSHIVFVKPFD